MQTTKMNSQIYKADILVVEDQPDNMRLLSNILKQQGYQVRQALDGEMALVAAEMMPPDLLLLDIKMPQMDGYQVCQQLKNKEITQEIPIIFMSAFDQVEDKVKAFNVGGVDYITKPYQPEEVIARVDHQVKVNLHQKQLKEQNNQLNKQLRLSEAAQGFKSQLQIDSYLLNQAIAATRNGIIITENNPPDYSIIYVNPGFEKMTGYSLEEVRGKNCSFLQGRDQDQPAIEEIRACLKEERECCVTLRNYRKDGSLFWNEVSLSPVRDEWKNVIYYIGIQTDVTNSKWAEEEKQRDESSLKQMNRELHKLTKELHRIANLDGLTEVANRRSFDYTLEQEWQRMARERAPLALILGDIDYFKKYNDTYGHLPGDDCLKSVAGAITKAVHRPADLVARYGGEEFAIILPNTPIQGAMKVAQSVLEAVRILQIPHKSSEAKPYVTMSLGVASLIPTPDLTSKAFIEKADIALFKAKNQGRDRAISHDEIK